MLARPSAGIGVVEVQKPMFFLRFLRCSRNPLRGSAWSRCKKKRLFVTFVVRTGRRELSRGSCACSRNRRVAGSIPPWSAGGRRKMQLAFYSNLRRATCAEQVAQSNLRRPTCTDQFAQSALPRATCAEQLTQSNLHRATCTEQLAQSNLQGAQFAQSNLHSATCVEQLAQTNLHRPVCAEHLAWCCLALASRSVGKKNASCSVGPTSLAMFCFRANRGLVQQVQRNSESVASIRQQVCLRPRAQIRERHDWHCSCCSRALILIWSYILDAALAA